MKIIKHQNTVFNSVSYIVVNEMTSECIVIDVGDAEKIISHIEEYSLKGILLTHAHYDHIYGLNRLNAVYPDIRIYTNPAGKAALLNPIDNLSFFHDSNFIFSSPNMVECIDDLDRLNIVKGLNIQAFYTPGHNPGCITWLVNDSLFSGDSFIPGVKTVTKLNGGNEAQALESEKLIMKLAENREIFPGHTIGGKPIDSHTAHIDKLYND